MVCYKNISMLYNKGKDDEDRGIALPHFVSYCKYYRHSWWLSRRHHVPDIANFTLAAEAYSSYRAG